MVKRIMAGLGITAVFAFALPTAVEAQMTSAPKHEQATITGTVIDLSCKFRHGLSGADHRMCSQVCADKGIPLAILTSNGSLYLPVSGGMPGESQNARLKEFAEQEVTITGKVLEAGGAKAIEIEKIARKS